MKDFYDYMLAHKKMEIEKFCLGETNQIAMKKDATAYPGFSVRNICANLAALPIRRGIYVTSMRSARNPIRLSSVKTE